MSDESTPTKPIVLFVDDETAVLDGIRTSLRKDRKRFDLRFAPSGADALEIIEAEDVAVVVSDMRMPRMTGAELLDHARVISPATVRIVLTGEAEEALVMRAIHVAHQWLTKPCGREGVVASIESALQYRSVFTNAELAGAVGRLGAVPSPPARYLRMVELVQSASTSAETIAEEISTDPAAAAKVIQLANSAFSGASPVIDIQAAVTRVGLDNVAHVVLSSELYRPWPEDHPLPGADIETLAALAEHAAAIARAVASPADATAAGLGALLHLVGFLVEAQEDAEHLAADYARAEETGSSLVAVQLERRGTSHGQVGAHLLSMWGLPTPTVLAVSGAFDPIHRIDEELDTTSAVHLAVSAATAAFADRLGAPLRVDVDEDIRPTLESLSEQAAGVEATT